MSQVKVFVTDRGTDGQTDRRMSFNVPRFRERRGTINFKYEINIQNVKHKNEQFYKLANDYVSQIKFDFCL